MFKFFPSHPPSLPCLTSCLKHSLLSQPQDGESERERARKRERERESERENFFFGERERERAPTHVDRITVCARTRAEGGHKIKGEQCIRNPCFASNCLLSKPYLEYLKRMQPTEPFGFRVQGGLRIGATSSTLNPMHTFKGDASSGTSWVRSSRIQARELLG